VSRTRQIAISSHREIDACAQVRVTQIAAAWIVSPCASAAQAHGAGESVASGGRVNRVHLYCRKMANTTRVGDHEAAVAHHQGDLMS